jgi:hypothetical protein
MQGDMEGLLSISHNESRELLFCSGFPTALFGAVTRLRSGQWGDSDLDCRQNEEILLVTRKSRQRPEPNLHPVQLKPRRYSSGV